VKGLSIVEAELEPARCRVDREDAALIKVGRGALLEPAAIGDEVVEQDRWRGGAHRRLVAIQRERIAGVGDGRRMPG
jgi:hypothetical protein